MHKIIRWLKRSKVAILIAVTFLIVGAGAGAFTVLWLNPTPTLQIQHELDNQYHFISPLLACNIDQNLGSDQTVALQNQLQASIQAHNDAGDITTASVYFRDLSGGPYIDINADDTFSPGSLLKVPLAMSIYEQAESNPSILTQELNYTGTETNDPQFFPPTKVLAPGQYTVSQLLTQMLTQSDNNATNVLANYIGVSAFEATYQHIGVAVPPTEGQDYTTTTHAYASFFSILYNATYLDADDSEAMLNLLSQTSFKQGIVAGVPKGIVVSHKFGERAFADSSLDQLHDCGIVYAPNHPYVICIMTQGYDFAKLAKTIADLSNVAYNYVE